MEEATLGSGTPPGMPPSHAACIPRAPAQLLRDLVLLVREARTPDLSVKGRAEGPHCPSVCADTRGRPAHKCLADKVECVEASEYCQQAARLWLMGVPVCIDVLLLPKCRLHGDQCQQDAATAAAERDFGRRNDTSDASCETRREKNSGESHTAVCRGRGRNVRGNIPSQLPGKLDRERHVLEDDQREAPSGQFVSGTGWSPLIVSEEKGFLLERWTIEARKRMQDDGIAATMLIQAVRSYLHFSQISSWLYSNRGKLAGVLVYRVNAPMEEPGLEVHHLSDVHQFPSCSTGPCSRLLVTVASLPRQPSVPRLPASNCGREDSKASERGETDKSSLFFRDLKDREILSQKPLRSKQEFRHGDSACLPFTEESVKDANEKRLDQGFAAGGNHHRCLQQATVSLDQRRLSHSYLIEPESETGQIRRSKEKAWREQKEAPGTRSELCLVRQHIDTDASVDERASLASSLESHSTLSSFDESVASGTGRDSAPDSSSLRSRSIDVRSARVESQNSQNPTRNTPTSESSNGHPDAAKPRRCDQVKQSGRKLKARVTKKDGENDMRIEQRKLVNEGSEEGRQSLQAERVKETVLRARSLEDVGQKQQQLTGQQSLQGNKKRQRKQRQQKLRKQKQEQFRQLREQQQQQQQQQEKQMQQGQKQPQALRVLSSKVLPTIPSKQETNASSNNGVKVTAQTSSERSYDWLCASSKLRSKDSHGREKVKIAEQLHRDTKQEVSEEEFIRRLSDRLYANSDLGQAWKSEYAQQLRDEMFFKEEEDMRRSRQNNKINSGLEQDTLKGTLRSQKTWNKERLGAVKVWSESHNDIHELGRRQVVNKSAISQGTGIYQDFSSFNTENKSVKRAVESKHGGGMKSLRDLGVNVEQNKMEDNSKTPLDSQRNSKVLQTREDDNLPRSVACDAVVSDFHQLSIDVGRASIESHKNYSIISPLPTSCRRPDMSSSSSSDTTPVASPRPNSALGSKEADSESRVSSKSLVKVVSQKLAKKALSQSGGVSGDSSAAGDKASQSMQKSWQEDGCDPHNSFHLLEGPAKLFTEEMQTSKDAGLSLVNQLTTVECTNSCLPLNSGQFVSTSFTSGSDGSVSISSELSHSRQAHRPVSQVSSNISITQAQNLKSNHNIPINNTQNCDTNGNVPITPPQANSRRIFQENLLPIMSYDAASETFKSVGGDWPAWNEDSGNYHDSACPHHNTRSPGEPALPSQPVLHSPKVLFSSDLPGMGFNMDGSVDLVARLTLPGFSNELPDSSDVGRGTQQDDEEESTGTSDHLDYQWDDSRKNSVRPTEEICKGNSWNSLTSTDYIVAVKGRHVACRQLDYSLIQQSVQAAPCHDVCRKESSTSSYESADINGSWATSKAIEIVVQKERVLQERVAMERTTTRWQDAITLGDQDGQEHSRLESTENTAQPAGLQTLGGAGKPQHKLPSSKLSPQFAAVSVSSSLSPLSSSLSSSSSSSSSSVRLVASQSSGPVTLPVSSSLLSMAPEKHDSTLSPYFLAPATPSSSIAAAVVNRNSTTTSIPFPLTLGSSSHEEKTPTLGEKVCDSNNIIINSSSSSSTNITIGSNSNILNSRLGEGSIPTSLSSSSVENYTNQPSLHNELTKSLLTHKSHEISEAIPTSTYQPGETIPTNLRPPINQSYALLLGELIPFTACQNGTNACIPQAEQNLPDKTVHRNTQEHWSNSLGHAENSSLPPSHLPSARREGENSREFSPLVNENRKGTEFSVCLASSDTHNDSNYSTLTPELAIRDWDCKKSSYNKVSDDAGDNDVVFYLPETNEELSDSSEAFSLSNLAKSSSHVMSANQIDFKEVDDRSESQSTGTGTTASCSINCGGQRSSILCAGQWLDCSQQVRSESVSSSSLASSSLAVDESNRERQHSAKDAPNLLGSLSCGMDKAIAATSGGARENSIWSSAPPHRTVSTPSRLDSGADVASSSGRLTAGHPSMHQHQRRLAMRSSSMVFNNRTGLPTQSSPAPLKRKPGCSRFDYDASLVGARAIQSALSCSGLASSSNATSSRPEVKGLSTSAPASSNCLLGNFEESLLNGRISPAGVVDGFTCELGASGSFCPSHLKLPVTAFFFSSLSDDNAPSPYLGHINLETVGKRGYHIPKQGTVQVTLFNPSRTVVKMFVVRYDLSDMPPSSRTFLRQRTVYCPTEVNSDAPSYLRYLIHLRFASSQSGKIYLHTDVRLIFARHKLEIDSTSGEYQLKSYTESPRNPKYSSKR
ncbi:protein FAM214A-like [Elysia marginata]|uniref:Protein FAM214A-like n=1 Tax=Elysia marginata TaxID=1093978 RepID=A0AAV4IQ60_9GAST|nr:protein FAM214A-like [Elysia marginata]